ncbi:MAG TPA: DUF924 family protein [Kofleriaceae bacterium]|jgi:uncharacterized protein (DUF924 family)
MKPMDPRIDEVLRFWFTQNGYKQWFSKDAAFDERLRDRFGALHADASDGGLERWRGSARGELALIIVLDQFSRNLFRDSAKSFANDDRALRLAKELVSTGRAAELNFTERAFGLMPFEHSESKDTQMQSVEAFEALAATAQGADIDLAKNIVDFAKKHAEVIEKFGRFPHRNAALGRTSTPEEIAYLATPGSSF